jgi:hypothetical protein
MYIDICQAEKDKIYSMPLALRKELSLIGGSFFPPHEVPMEALLMNSTLDFDSPEGSIGYALATPWEGKVMDEIINVGNTYSLDSPLISDDLDRNFQSRLICFAINVMLMLSALPPEEQNKLRQETRVIRQPKLEGKHAIAGLYPAKLIGVEQVPKQTRLQLKSEPTGRHLSAHWRRGHWRRQAYGPKSGLRRFQWIAPYHVGQE